MAKKEEGTLAPAASENVPAILVTAEGKQVSVADLLDQMNSAEVGMELGADYLKFEDGEQTRVIFIEMTSMNGMGEKSGEQVEAVKLLGKDGRFKINADKVLVSTCRALAAKGRSNVAIQITSQGKVKGPNGSYRDLIVNELLIK